jgi:hypothetical protein
MRICIYVYVCMYIFLYIHVCACICLSIYICIYFYLLYTVMFINFINHIHFLFLGIKAGGKIESGQACNVHEHASTLMFLYVHMYLRIHACLHIRTRVIILI